MPDILKGQYYTVLDLVKACPRLLKDFLVQAGTVGAPFHTFTQRANVALKLAERGGDSRHGARG